MSYTLNRRITFMMIVLMILSLLLPLGNLAKADNGDDGGSLTIYKFEQEAGAENPPGNGESIDTSQLEGDLIGGVTFELIQTHSYNPDTDKWTEVTDGPTFTGETDDNGELIFNFTPDELGRYTVQETDGPPNVVLNDTIYTVDIPMTSADGSDLNYNVFIYPKNEIARAGVTLKKIDGDTEAAMPGVEFELYEKDENGDFVKEGEYTTGPDGTITVDGLPVGDYYFVETATLDGYLINGEHINFTITSEDAGTTIDLSTINNFKEPEVEKEVSEPEVNRGDTITYTITVDMPSNIGEYTEFTVTDTLDPNLTYTDGTANTPDGFTVDYDDATHTLTWTATDTSQITDDQVKFTFDATINDDAPVNTNIDNQATIDFNNGYDTGSKTDDVPVVPHAGTLEVIKQDGKSHEGLDGAEFDLHDADGNLIATGVSGADGKVDFTPVDDNYNMDRLNYGDYVLTETKAPEGYSKLKNPIEFSINSDKSKISLEVDNYTSEWNLPQTGGMGTLLFTLIGLGLMGTAFFLFIANRRKHHTS